MIDKENKTTHHTFRRLMYMVHRQGKMQPLMSQSNIWYPIITVRDKTTINLFYLVKTN